MRTVIDAVLARSSRVHVIVKTSAPRGLFDHEDTHLRASRDGGQAKTRTEVTALQCDAGVVQINSLQIDVAESIRRAHAFQAALPSMVQAEAAFLRRHRARVVVGDIPPLAFAAAAAAGIPSLAVGNFTWDWIYEGYPGDGVLELAEDIRRVYSDTTAALRLPMWGGFAGLEGKTRDIPFIAYRSPLEPDDVRKRLGLPDRTQGGPLVLFAFGGHGITPLDTPVRRACTILATVSNEQLLAARLRYQDVVRAADVVVTKPGYGIITDAIANGAALLYTSRGEFREYDVLVREMPRYVRARFIEPADLLRGGWADALAPLLAQPEPPERPKLNGAEIVAEEILTLARVSTAYGAPRRAER